MILTMVLNNIKKLPFHTSILNVVLNQCGFSPTFTETTSHRFDLSEYATDGYVTGSARQLPDVYPKSTEGITNSV